MKVKYLIEELKKMPDDASVWSAKHDSCEGWLVDLISIVELDKHGDVILREENGISLRYE